jgi:hypothetical protein
MGNVVILVRFEVITAVTVGVEIEAAGSLEILAYIYQTTQ